MGTPVKTVTPDAVIAIKRVRNRIQVGARRQGLMEGGIEHGDLGNRGERLLERPDPLDIRGIVKRRHRRDRLDFVQDASIDPDRGAEALAAVHHAVTGGLDPVKQRPIPEFDKERRELEEEPEDELAELAGLYVRKGLDEDLARQVAVQLTEHDALGAHAEAELGIDPDDITSAWNAAWASMVSFTLGALLPLLTITPRSERIVTPAKSRSRS